MVTAVAAMALLIAAPAGAQDPVIEIPIETVVRGPVGSENEIATSDVDPALVGSQCTVTVTGVNNESVHPGNNLIVRSGGTEVVAEDVEREPGAVTEAEGLLDLGDTLTLLVVLGSDGVFSGGGLLVTLECATPPTTAPPETTTTTTPSGTSPPAPVAVPVSGTPSFVG